MFILLQYDLETQTHTLVVDLVSNPQGM